MLFESANTTNFTPEVRMAFFSEDHHDDVRYRGRKHTTPSPERSVTYADDTDAPSVSPFSLSFFKLGLPTAGYVMIVTEIIPSFIHFALSHFNIDAYEDTVHFWFDHQFYAVVLAIPSCFLIATLSDGYVYGKLIACLIMLTLMFLTSLCSLLETVQGISPNFLWIVDHLSRYSLFVFYVTIPIRMTIFTDVFAKHRNHERARKTFAAYWVCNFVGVCALAAIYQYYFEKDSPYIHYRLMIALVALNLVYFLLTLAILLYLPLELPLKNQFLFTISIMCYAIRRMKRWKGSNWLEPALDKYTQTEVKRTRSLALLLMLVFPVMCYCNGHVYIYFNWYNYGDAFQWFGSMTHSYNCMYGHMLFSIIFIIVVEVVGIPTLYHLFGHFNGIWLAVAGIFIMGIPVTTLLVNRVSCAEQDIAAEEPIIVFLNGYPEEILLYSDWLEPNGGKGHAIIPPGGNLTISPPESVIGTVGEATVFQFPSMKVTDFLVITKKKGFVSIYLLYPFQHEQVELKDTDIRAAPHMVLYGPFSYRKGTMVVFCSPDLYTVPLKIQCSYAGQEGDVEMQEYDLCVTKSLHNGVALITHPILLIVRWPAGEYTCIIEQDTISLNIQLNDFVAVHITSSVHTETKSHLEANFFYHKDGIRREAFVLSTNLAAPICQIPYVLLVLQLVTYGLSIALSLISIITIHCLHGPPRMRMMSYALPSVGAYTGACIERLILSSGLDKVDEAIIMEVIWASGCLAITFIAVYCRFEHHSWDIHRRPSIFWKLRAWWRQRSARKEKPPPLYVPSASNTSTKGILQHDFIMDKTADDDKVDRKVTFSED